MQRIHLSLLFFCLAALSACQATPQQATPPATTPVVITPAPTPAVASDGMMTAASGLQYQDITVGTGKKPGFNQKVRIAYVGKLANGLKFDSGSNDFKLGVGEVIKGWDQGIVGGGGVEPMREGGKRKLIIPPALGYGDKAMSTIPPNSTLIFEVELLRVLGGTGFGR